MEQDATATIGHGLGVAPNDYYYKKKIVLLEIG
jgi:hypothetical protein